MSCECKCKFDRSWNNDKCRCELKKHHICEKYYIWNPATYGVMQLYSHMTKK